MINVALNSCDLNAVHNVLSGLWQEATGVKKKRNIVLLDCFKKHVLSLSWVMSGVGDTTTRDTSPWICKAAIKSDIYSDIRKTSTFFCFFFSSQYPFGENMETSLLRPLEASLQTTTNTYCGRASHLFTKKLKQSIMSVQQEATQRRWLGQHSNIIPWLLSDWWLGFKTLLWRQWAGWRTDSGQHWTIVCLQTAYQGCGNGEQKSVEQVIFFIFKWSQCLYISVQWTHNWVTNVALNPLCPVEILDFIADKKDTPDNQVVLFLVMRRNLQLFCTIL